MEMRTLMSQAAETTGRIVQGVSPQLLDAKTPCPEYDVRTMVNHLFDFTGQRSASAARKEPYDGPGPEYDHTADSGWAEQYAADARGAAEAWADPAAWEGQTSLTGQAQMPAQMIGGIVLGELAVHGWDLAMATGQKYELSPELSEQLLEQFTGFAEMARQGGAFGPEVPVPDDAPNFDRVLGLAGRDPSWTPSKR